MNDFFACNTILICGLNDPYSNLKNIKSYTVINTPIFEDQK